MIYLKEFKKEKYPKFKIKGYWKTFRFFHNTNFGMIGFWNKLSWSFQRAIYNQAS